MPSDQIDRIAGLAADSPLAALRRERPDFVDGAETCRDTVLNPQHDNGLPHPLRMALAARMARQNGDLALAASYDDRLAALAPSAALTAIAAGAVASDPWTAAVIHHADLVTIHPRDCRREDIAALTEAGLATPTIVALSELIAFVNYEARIIAGLRLLEHAA